LAARQAAVAAGSCHDSLWQKPLLHPDRPDSVSYEVGLSRPHFRPTTADHELAEHFFGRLKMTSHPVDLVP
jgi:hypothetical protein